MAKRHVPVSDSDPLENALFQPADAYAIRAWSEGRATDLQQIRAFDWIMNATGLRKDHRFVPGQDDARNYLAGRRNIGWQIANLVTWKSDKPELETLPDDER